MSGRRGRFALYALVVVLLGVGVQGGIAFAHAAIHSSDHSAAAGAVAFGRRVAQVCAGLAPDPGDTSDGGAGSVLAGDGGSPGTTTSEEGGGDHVAGTDSINPCKITVHISASPSSIVSGQSTTVTWDSSSASGSPYDCSLTSSPDVFSSTATGGSHQLTLTSSTTFSLTCEDGNPADSDSASASVSVSPPPHEEHPPNTPALFTPGDGAIVTTKGPTLGVTYTDPDGDSGTVRFTISNLNGTVATYTSGSVANGNVAFWPFRRERSSLPLSTRGRRPARTSMVRSRRLASGGSWL